MLSGTVGNRIGRFGKQRLKMRRGAFEPKLVNGVRPAVRLILPAGLASLFRIRRHVANVVSNLESFAKTFAQPLPFAGRGARSKGSGGGRRSEQRAGLRPVIFGERYARLALPGLAGNNARRCPDGAGHDHQELRQAIWRFSAIPGQRLEGANNQRIADQHRQRLAEGSMHRRLSPPLFGVVKAGEIVMNERCAMQKLDRGRRGVGDVGKLVAASLGHCKRKPRTHPGTAWKDGVPERRGKLGWNAWTTHAGDRVL